MQLHRRVVVGHAVRRLPRCCAATSRTRAAGGLVSRGRRRQMAAVEGHPEPGERRSRSPPSIPYERRPEPQLPGRARRPGVRREDQPEGRALLAAGLHDQRLRQAPPGRLRRAARPTTSESSTASRRSQPERSRPTQFADLNSKLGGYDMNYNDTNGAHRGRRLSRSTTSTRAAPSTRRTTSTRSRSSTCAARILARSTTSTARTRCERGCQRELRHRPPTRSCGAAKPRCSATRATPTSPSSRSTRWLARDREGPRATCRSRRR